MLELERDEITSRTYRQPEWKIYYDDGTPVSEDEHPVTRVLEKKEPDYGFEHWIDLRTEPNAGCRAIRHLY